MLGAPSPSRVDPEPRARATSGAAVTTDAPGVIAYPPILYGAAFALGIVPRWVWPEPLLPPATSVGIGLSLLVLGATLAIWGNRTLRQAGTNAHPAFPTRVLVVTGPFAYSRNPLYLARTLLYVGLALTMNMPWTFVTLVPLLVVMHYGVIAREERYLEAKFGSAYRRYRDDVRRWL